MEEKRKKSRLQHVGLIPGETCRLTVDRKIIVTLSLV
jgi:hypothetical protein